MNREADPQEWLRYAENDRQAARHLLEAGDYETCAFHCQQAVEKLLKAVIIRQTGQRPRHTHEMNALLEQLGDFEIEPEMAQSISGIGVYYVGTRYPLDVVDPGIFIRPLAESAVQRMEAIFKWFLTRINFDKE